MITRSAVLRPIWTVGAGLLVAVASLSAQAHEHDPPDQPSEAGGMGGMMQMMGQGMMGGGMMGPGMMQMMGQGMGMMATGGPGPAMVLRMGDALNLTEEQRERLQAIQSRFSESAEPLMAAVMEAHRSATSALQGESPDLDAYERALREGADRMVEAHMAMARAAAEARDVLTEEQRGRLQEEGAQMMRGMMGPGGMMQMMGPGMRR